MQVLDTAEYWEDAAERYERTAHPYTVRDVDVALAHVPLSPASRVIDIAVGTGALALAAAERGAQVLATDFSSAMVARIAAKAVPIRLRKLSSSLLAQALSALSGVRRLLVRLLQ